MLPPSIRRLALADVDDDALRQLARHGESHLVERKVTPPEPPRFGAAAAAFANTLGGWILLGVANDGDAVGWTGPGRADLQSYLGQLLRQQVDPVPPYVAEMRELDGKPVGVMRVFESADTPHVVRGSGAVYVRTPQGKEPTPLDDHRSLLEFAQRGDLAEQNALDRLRALPAVGYVFGAPDSNFDPPEFEGFHYVARAAPLTVTPAFRDWPITKAAADQCAVLADRMLPPVSVPWGREGPRVDPFGRAVAVTVAQGVGGMRNDEAVVMADSGGVVAAAFRRAVGRNDRVVLPIDDMLDDQIRPLAQALTDLLVAAEAYGRALLDFWIIAPAEVIYRDQRGRRFKVLHAAGELSIPSDQAEVEALASSWHRELQRTLGIAQFER